MITYEQLSKMCERWRTSIPTITDEEDRRIIYIALVAAKANLKENTKK